MANDVQSLIKACLSGDETCWNDFFHKFGSLAIHILTNRYPAFTPDENDDIIQNIFIKLSRGGLRNFNGTTGYEFLAYFKQITVNEAFTWLRLIKRREREISIDQDTDSDDEYALSRASIKSSSVASAIAIC